jgi:hypothetical protein
MDMERLENGSGVVGATQILGSTAENLRFIRIRRVPSAFAAIASSKSSKANENMIASYTDPAPQLALRLV